ncbi:MAG: putative prokaryotic signal transducing protein [Verrucomicrobiota bacterium]|jgi:hypothetical protein
MTTVINCSNPAEAMLLKSVLEANQIPAYVPEELTAQAAVHFAGGGIRVMVDEENVAAAQRILAEAEAAFNDEEDPEEHDDAPSPRQQP